MAALLGFFGMRSAAARAKDEGRGRELSASLLGVDRKFGLRDPEGASLMIDEAVRAKF